MQLRPTSAPHYKFAYTSHLLWGIWALALVGLILLLYRRRTQARRLARA
jgi:uncharacterized membrane protein